MNRWKRRWWWYECEVTRPVGMVYVMKTKRKLSFVAYHLIKYLHGEEKLIEIGNTFWE